MYNIDDKIGHPLATQAAAAFDGQFFSPEDLANFQEFLGIPLRPVDFSGKILLMLLQKSV